MKIVRFSAMTTPLAATIASSAVAQTPAPAPATAELSATSDEASAEDTAFVGRQSWCDDTGTYCWNQASVGFNGVRILAEPQFGTVLTFGDDKLEQDGFKGSIGLGLEFNLYRALIAGQVYYVAPFEAQFDDESPGKDNIRPGRETVSAEFGLGVGLSFFDGVIAGGFGLVHLDRRDFVDPSQTKQDNKFIYVNIQLVSAIRAAIKNLK